MRVYRLVEKKMDEENPSPMTDMDWNIIQDATIQLSVLEASWLYITFTQVVTDAPDCHILPFFRKGSFDAQRFHKYFLSNGRWMEYLADAIDEPNVEARQRNLLHRRIENKRLGASQRHMAQEDVRQSSLRLARKQSAKNAFESRVDSLRIRFPEIQWNDVASTHPAAWQALRLSQLDATDRLALVYIAPLVSRKEVREDILYSDGLRILKEENTP